MRAHCVALFFLVSFSEVCGQQTISIREAEGGPVTINLGQRVHINDGSSLIRKALMVDNPTCPLSIVHCSVITDANTRGLQFRLAGDIKSIMPVVGYELRIAIFDAFNEHISTLELTNLCDLDSLQEQKLYPLAEWVAGENDARSFLSSVAFISKVRTASGIVWKEDYNLLWKAIKAKGLNLDEDDLEPIELFR